MFSFNADHVPLLDEASNNKRVSCNYKRAIIFLISCICLALLWHFSGSADHDLSSNPSNHQLSIESDGRKSTSFLTARAEFNNYGVNGFAEIDVKGNVAININVNELDATECSDNGKEFSYHIHNNWNYHDTVIEDKFGADACGAEATGAHFNPFGVDVCDNLSVNEDITYYNCEIGDLSGRFGKAIPDTNGDIIIVGRVANLRPEMVYRRSVVFHCSDGQRLFCSPFSIQYIE